MLNDAYLEMTSLSEVDAFCRDYYLKTGQYMEKPSMEEIRNLLRMWGKFDNVMSEEDLNRVIARENSEGLSEIFNRESLFFEEGKDISILCANRYFKTPVHTHRYFEIECVAEGSGIYNPGENQIWLNQGDIVLVPPETPHITRPVDSSTVVDLEIRLSTFEKTFRDILAADLPISAFFKNAIYGNGKRNCVILDGMLDETALEILTLIWKESAKDDFVSGKKCVHLTEALLYHLAETVTREHVNDVLEYQNEEMYQIRMYMLAHMNTVTLNEIARYFHRSDSVISRYIKTHSGKGFAELLQNMRLERAADLLRTTDMDVASTGSAVGYAGESHFINCFRKKYGLTPLQYRRSKNGNSRR